MVAGIKWGVLTGLLLGGINTFVILWIVPSFGWDILFLKETPHAGMTTWVMVPWGILVIAIGVELNFRGFLLGRLETLYCQWFRDVSRDGLNAGSFLAIVSSGLVFAFDPFMVTTFQRLHWIALWDGLVWGWIFIRMKNLLVVIVAHAVEVVILYCCIKTALL
ncbi:MAG: CPBP family glutamic-type intramembrane protease [Nitrospirota bacterium]|nr:CPBP family glutamic-type intramembrane protease [Nitrospirota bacterium]